MSTITKDDKRIYAPNKNSLYTEFILWTAMPYQEKIKLGMEWQQDFAAYYKVAESTLWRWKKREDFEKRVDAILKMWATDKTPDVIHSIYRSAVKGNPFSQQLWLGYFKGYNPKKGSEEKSSGKVEIGENDIRFIINGLPEPMRTKYNEYITEIIIGANEVKNARTIDDIGWDEQRPENYLSDETDSDAQDIPDQRANVVAFGYTERVCKNMERKVSENYHQSSKRWG